MIKNIYTRLGSTNLTIENEYEIFDILAATGEKFIFIIDEWDTKNT